MKIRKNIAVSDSGFLFNPSTGDSYSVNPMGFDILKLVKEGKSNDEIIALILEEYSIDKSSLEKDLYDFNRMLDSYKLIEK